MAASGLGFLCPRLPVSWRGCLLSRVATRQLPGPLSTGHSGLGLLRQWKGPVSQACSQSDTCPPASVNSVSAGAACVWWAGLREVLGSAGFDLGLDLCPAQLPSSQFSLAGGRVGLVAGHGHCGLRAAQQGDKVADLSLETEGSFWASQPVCFERGCLWRGRPAGLGSPGNLWAESGASGHRWEVGQVAQQPTVPVLVWGGPGPPHPATDTHRESLQRGDCTLGAAIWEEPREPQWAAHTV